MSRIAVLGAGAWGTALALSLARRADQQITLWAHAPAHARELADTRENRRYLPGYHLSPEIRIASDLRDSVRDAEVLLCVTPSQHLRSTVVALAPFLTRDQIVVSASKGLEEATHLRMSEVIASVAANPTAVLSGPSFAQEVAAAQPTAVVIASTFPGVAQRLQQDFSSTSLRLYTHDDVAGVELGGALKNVIALASGVVYGLDLGSNTSAALITRGMAEITRLALACGGRGQTLAGLAGIGDLVLTATGALSRNRLVGIELGRGRALPDILASLDGKVAEGVRATIGALGLAARYGVEMPITEQMHAVLYRNKPPREAIRDLMARPGREE